MLVLHHYHCDHLAIIPPSERKGANSREPLTVTRPFLASPSSQTPELWFGGAIKSHLDHVAETVHGARMLETLEDDEKTMRMEYELNIRHIIDGLRKSSLALAAS